MKATYKIAIFLIVLFSIIIGLFVNFNQVDWELCFVILLFIVCVFLIIYGYINSKRAYEED